MNIGVEQYLATIDPLCGLLYDAPLEKLSPRTVMANSSTPFPTLVQACSGMPRDDAAWSELLARFDGHVQGLALHYLRSHHSRFPDLQEEALELSMQAWMRLCQHDNRALRGFRGDNEGAFIAYLARLVRNLVVDAVRRQSAQRRPQFEDPGDTPVEAMEGRTAGEAAEERDLRNIVAAELLDLWEGKSSCHRNVVICQLTWFEQLSAERIAEIGALGLTRGGVEKVVAQGMSRLRDRLGPGKIEAMQQEDRS